jgi:hypothetical protein
MADGERKDVFKQFSESTVEQVANLAQLAAEARRLGLIPEFPRELIEKLDVGGTLLDLFRLQLKHTTALTSILGPQARNLEKLNHLSALISTGKSSAPRVISGDCKLEGRASFELSIDNPVDRPQKLSVHLNKIYSRGGGNSAEFAAPPGSRSPGSHSPGSHSPGSHSPGSPEAGQAHDQSGSSEPIVWQLSPAIDEVDPHALRSCSITFDVKRSHFAAGIYETTAIVRLSPLGTLHRYQLVLTVK